MRWRETTLMVLGALLLPGVSSALDVDGALSADAEYDSNVLRTSEGGVQDDAIFRITPLVMLLEDDGNFQWKLNYRFPYEVAVNTSRVDGFRHFLNANGDWYLSERTRIYGTNNFSKSDALSRTGGTTTNDTATIGAFRAPVWRNRAEVGVSHAFTPRMAGDLSFNYRYFDTNLLNRAQNDVFAGNGSVSYMLTERHRVGGGATATYQDFAESNAGTRPSSQTFFLNVFGSWTWLIDETTTLELAGGPTYIDTQQDAPKPIVFPTVPFAELNGGVTAVNFSSCGDGGGDSGNPVFQGCSGSLRVAPAFEDGIRDAGNQDLVFRPGQNPGSENTNDLNFFASASLAKRWNPVHNTRFTYRRTDSTASGLGSSVLDDVVLVHTWNPAERWTVSLRADFTHRASTSQQNQTLVEVGGRTLINGCLDANGGAFTCTIAQTLSGTTFLTSRKVNNAVNTNRWGVGTQLSHRLTRHLDIGLRYRFNQQASASGSVGSFSDFGDHLVTLGVQYDFDRYSLDKYVPW